MGEYKEIKYDDNFYEKQLQILNSIKKNKSSEVIKNLQLKKQQDNVSYERMFITESLECTSKQIVDILSTTKVYRQIFDRLFNGKVQLLYSSSIFGFSLLLQSKSKHIHFTYGLLYNC